MKTKISLEIAKRKASEIVEFLTPFVQRIEIAGSIRRQKEFVGDVEIVVIPKMTEVRNLFGESAGMISNLESAPFVEIGRLTKNGSKFKQILLTEGYCLDLFVVTHPAQWGLILCLRTGPSQFSQWTMTQRNKGGVLPSYAKVKNGFVYVDEKVFPCPEEIDFLNFCDLGWVEPSERSANWAVKNSF